MPMNLHVNDILDHLFQKRTLEDVDARDIEQLVIKYPFYAPAQYLLAKKYQQPGDERYADQVKKSALYFTNPHWLNALLHPEALPEREIEDTEQAAVAAGEAVVDAAPGYVVEEEMPEDTFGKTVVDIVEERLMVEEKPAEVIIDQVVDTGIAGKAENVENVQHEEVEEALNSGLPVAEIKTGNEVLEQLAESETGAEAGKENADENVDEAIEQTLLQDDIKLPTGDFSLAEAKAAFNKPLPDNIKAGDAIIPIEPLHTVDYFASQGIRLSNEYAGKDKLSQKLKSFTEWLKTMKKIHPERLEAELDSNAQSTIQNMAEHSNEQKETVTEAMAEVYARQGLHKKAIETYQKLSLLNPGKRVYFAAKISKLNEN